jgi:hypothetical protein
MRNCPHVRLSGLPPRLKRGAVSRVYLGSTRMRLSFEPTVKTSPANGTIPRAGVGGVKVVDAPATVV